MPDELIPRNELARSLRQKYPGKLDYQSDEDIVNKYLKQFPNALDKFASAPTMPVAPTITGGESRALTYESDNLKGTGVDVLRMLSGIATAVPLTAGKYWEVANQAIKKTVYPKINLMPKGSIPMTPQGKFAKDVHLNSREWYDKKIDGIIQADPELLNWQEDMRDLPNVTFNNFLSPKMLGKTFQMVAPSLGVNLAMRALTGPAGALLSMGLMETSGEFRESYEWYKSQPDKYTEEEAYELATSTAIIYGPISSILENLSLNFIIGKAGLSKVAWRTMVRKLSDKLGTGVKKAGKKIAFGDKGYLLDTVKRVGKVPLNIGKAVGGDIALPTLNAMAQSAMTESIEEWSQYMAQRVIQQSYRGGWGETPEDAANNFTKFVATEMVSNEAIFSLYAGAVGGGALSGPTSFASRTAASIGTRMNQRKADLSKETLEVINKAEEKFNKQKTARSKISIGKTKNKIVPDELTPEALREELKQFKQYPQTASGFMQNILASITEGHEIPFTLDKYDSNLGALVNSHQQRAGVENLTRGKRINDIITLLGNDSIKDLSKNQLKMVNSILGEEVGKQNKNFDKFILNQFDGNIVNAVLLGADKGGIDLKFVDSANKVGNVETRVDIRIDDDVKARAIRGARQWYIEKTKRTYPDTDKLVTPEDLPNHVSPETLQAIDNAIQFSISENPEQFGATVVNELEEQTDYEINEQHTMDQIGNEVPEGWVLDNSFEGNVNETVRTRGFKLEEAIGKYGEQNVRMVNVMDEKNENVIGYQIQIKDDFALPTSDDIINTKAPSGNEKVMNANIATQTALKSAESMLPKDMYDDLAQEYMSAAVSSDPITAYNELTDRINTAIYNYVEEDSAPTKIEDDINIEIDEAKLKAANEELSKATAADNTGIVSGDEANEIALNFASKILGDAEVTVQQTDVDADTGFKKAVSAMESLGSNIFNKLKEEGGYLRIKKPTANQTRIAYTDAEPMLTKMWDTARDFWDIPIHEYIPAFLKAADVHGKEAYTGIKELFKLWLIDKDLISTSEFYEKRRERMKDLDVLGINKSRHKQLVSEILSSDEFNTIVYKRNEAEEELGQAPEVVDGRRAALDFRDGIVQIGEAFHVPFLLEPVTQEEQRQLYTTMRENSYNQYREVVKEAYWDQPAYKNFQHKLPEYARNLRKAWNDEQIINKIPRTQAPEFQYVNIKPDGTWIDPRKDGVKKVERHVLLKQEIDLTTGNKLSNYVQNTFADERFKQYGMTISKLRFSDMITAYKRKDGTMYAREFKEAIPSYQTYVKWDAMLGNALDEGNANPQTIVGARTGGRGALYIIPVTTLDTAKATEWKSYWNKELSIYNEQTQKQTMDDILKMYKGMELSGGDKFIMAQIIARHEFMKKLKHTDYLNKYTTIDIFRRLSLDFAAGKVGVGMGDSNIEIFNPWETEQRYNGKVVQTVEELNEIDVSTGLKKLRYWNDGQIPTSEQYLYELGQATGYNDMFRNMFEAKTVINHKDGEDYLSVKGMEMIVRPGMSWHRNGELVAKSVKQTVNGKTFVNIVNADGVRIDKLVSTEEAKNRNGKFSVEGNYTIPEIATRLLQTQSPTSKKDSAHMNAWIHLLDDKEFGGIKKLLVDDYANVLKTYLKELYEIRTDEGRRKFIQSLYKEDSFIARELDRRIRPDGKKYIEGGYHAIDLQDMTNQQIYSRYFDDGMLKGRKSYRDGRTGATYATLKPNMTGEIQNENEMIVGDNKITISILRNLIGDKAFKGKQPIAVINEWLKTHDFYMVPFRQPVNGVYDIHIKRVLKIDTEIGDGFELHPRVVYNTIKGDHDGDKVFVHIFGDEINNEFLKLEQNPKFEELNMSAELGWFQNNSGTQSYLNPSSFYKTMHDVSLARNAPGVVRNAMITRQTLEAMKFEIQLDGVTIRPKKANNPTDMSYAPLSIGTTEESIPVGTSIYEKDGKRYLRTKVHHEMAILMNAATDVKDLLLSQWGYTDANFIIPRVFERTDGKAITEDHMTQLSVLFPIINPRSSFGKSGNIQEFYEDSEWLYDYKNMDTTNRMKSLYLRYVDALKNYGIKEYSIRRFDGNGYLDPLLETLAIPYEVNKQYNLSGQGITAVSTPVGYEVNRVKNAHHDAVNQVRAYELNNLGIKPGMISDSIKNPLYNVALTMRKEFDEMHSMGKLLTQYSTIKIDFVDKWLKKYSEKNYSKEEVSAINLMFTMGMPDDSPVMPTKVKERKDLLKAEALKLLKKIQTTEDAVLVSKMKQNYTAMQEEISSMVGEYRTKQSRTGTAVHEARSHLLPADLMTDDFIYAYSKYHDVLTASNKPVTTRTKNHMTTISEAYQELKDKDGC